jgi:hypothetical protein
MIEALMAAAPRERDGEVVGTLIGLHRALRIYVEECSLNDDAVNDVNAVLYPVEDVLGHYRPRSLAGLKAVLSFCVEQLGGELDKSDQVRTWLAAAAESAGLLARLETGRLHDQGIARLRLASPVTGRASDSACWAIPEGR